MPSPSLLATNSSRAAITTSPWISGQISTDKKRVLIKQWRWRCINPGTGFGAASLRDLERSLGPFDRMTFD